MSYLIGLQNQEINELKEKNKSLEYRNKILIFIISFLAGILIWRIS
jgi:hypothetical protein